MSSRPQPIPGDFTVRWTNLRVTKHDGSPHHGVGIQPTIPVTRTLAGVVAGRDEFLEAAIEAVSSP
jgi:C-terminal processing protease CtpA/Prc